MDLTDVDLSKLLPTEEEHETLNKYALIRKRLIQYLIDTFGEEYFDTLNPDAADQYGRLGWNGCYCEGAMSPEVFYACVDALGWGAIKSQHVDPYIEEYCDTYNEWMEKLEIVPNAAFLAAELSQAARENGMHIDIGDENGGRPYTPEEQARIGGVDMSYWEPKPPYNKIYFGRGLGSLTFDYNYKRYEDWCVKEGLPWRPFQNPEVLSEDIACSITSLIWAKYITGGALGKPDEVIDAHLDAENPDSFLMVVQCCAGKTKMAEREATGRTREWFETFLPVIEGILRSGDVSKHIKGENTGRGSSSRRKPNTKDVIPVKWAPIGVNGSAVANWTKLDINRGISAINKGIITNGIMTLRPGCKSCHQCAGGVSRLVAHMSGIDAPACNKYNATAAYNFMDGKLLKEGRFYPGGPTVPGMAGKWECVAELKGPGSLPSNYTPQPGDIVATDTGRRNGGGFHLEIFLGKNIGRSGWWSDFDQGKCLNYGCASQHKRYFRRTGD